MGKNLRQIYGELNPVVSFGAFYNRVHRSGWDIKKAAETPVMKNMKRDNHTKKYLTQPNGVEIRNDLMGKELKNQFFK